MQQSDAVREEHRQSGGHYNQGWDYRQHQGPFFEAQVHEVSHDQCCLDERKSHQHDEHRSNRKLDVGQEDFHTSQNQQPSPNGQRQLAAQSMGFRVGAQELPPEYVFRAQALAWVNCGSDPSKAEL